MHYFTVLYAMIFGMKDLAKADGPTNSLLDFMEVQLENLECLFIELESKLEGMQEELDIATSAQESFQLQVRLLRQENLSLKEQLTTRGQEDKRWYVIMFKDRIVGEWVSVGAFSEQAPTSRYCTRCINHNHPISLDDAEAVARELANQLGVLRYR